MGYLLQDCTPPMRGGWYHTQGTCSPEPPDNQKPELKKTGKKSRDGDQTTTNCPCMDGWRSQQKK